MHQGAGLANALRRRVFPSVYWQERLEIALEMIDAVSGYFRAVLGLGQNERALEHGLRIEGGATRRPFRIRRMARLGRGDVGFQPLGVLADVTVAGGANGGVRVVSLLHHRAEEASELRQFALK